MTATSRKTMSKVELAEALALALNLLNSVRCKAEDGFDRRDDDDFHKLVHMLPEQVQDDYRNNSAMFAKYLIGK